MTNLKPTPRTAPTTRGGLRDWVMMALAIAFGAALIIVTVAILWTALHNGKAGLAVTSTDAELLMAWGGGIIGIIGAYVGFRAGDTRRDRNRDITDQEVIE